MQAKTQKFSPRKTHQRLRTLLLASGVVLSLVACGTEAQAQTNEEGSSIVINIKDWTAAGSGCRARMNKGGDVTFEEMRPHSSASSKLMVLKFKLPSYQLSSPPTNPATSMTFARECAIRVVADPLGQYRIKSIAARTPITFSKDEKTTLKMQYILKLDGDIVAHSLSEVDEERSIRNQEDRVVLSGQATQEAALISNQSCGAPQMLGFDYTFIAARSQSSDAALIKLADDRQLELAVEVEPCRSASN